MAVTKKVNKHVCISGLFNASCTAYTQCHQFQLNFCNNFLFQIITKGCKNDTRGLVPSPTSCIQPVGGEGLRKKSTDASKEK